MTETTYLDDPEGNGIELYVDTPERGRWDMSDGEFRAVDAQGNPHSGREPLDLEGLFQEIRPEVPLEQGVPEGTVIGHVHLHVADLAQAIHFYHELLGFELMGVSDSVGVSFVAAGGYHHHIGLNTWLGQGAPPPADDTLGLRYFSVVIPNGNELRRLSDRLVQAGVTIERNEAGRLLRDPSQIPILLINRDR